MKSKKILKFNDLLKETIELIKQCAKTFEPKVPHIKKCLEDL